MSTVGYVGFSVNGEWLTGFIKEQFFHEGKGFDWVIQTISAMFKDQNGLDDKRIAQMAQDIILGRSRFTGNSGDGSFKYLDGSDEPIKPDFFRRYANMSKELKSEREARIDADEAWQELALVVKGEIKRADCANQRNVDLLKPTPIKEYIGRMIADDEDTPPYGFISPDGTFYPVDWCEHEEFAWRKIREKYEEEEAFSEFTGKDFLICQKGWLLLHNPSRGNPILTSGDKPMTKAQREFLFDYYTKYDMKKEANALYQEVEA